MGKSSESPVTCMRTVCNWLAVIDGMQCCSKYDDNRSQPDRKRCLLVGSGKDSHTDPRYHVVAKLDFQDTKLMTVMKGMQKAPCA